MTSRRATFLSGNASLILSGFLCDCYPISRQIFYEIWYVDSFCQEQKQVLSVTQPEVIYAACE